MRKSICFFDVDNTLVPFGNKDFSTDVKEALMSLKNNGHYIVVNTGRTKGSIAKYVRNFPFDVFISGCGTDIELTGKTIYNYKFDSSKQKEIIDTIKEYKLEASIEGKDSYGYVYDHNEICKHTIDSVGGDSDNKLDNPYEVDFVKFCLFLNPDSDINGFISKYSDIFDFTRREDAKEAFYECVPKGHTKGSALIKCAELLGIDIDDCYCFGDSSNDLSMLNVVKHSICMANGSQEVKDVCEFVTRDCKSDGIKYACKHYGLI